MTHRRPTPNLEVACATSRFDERRMDGYLDPYAQTLRFGKNRPSKHPDAYPDFTPKQPSISLQPPVARNFLGNQNTLPELPIHSTLRPTEPRHVTRAHQPTQTRCEQ